LIKCNIIITRMRAAKLRFHLSCLHQVLKLPYTIRRRVVPEHEYQQLFVRLYRVESSKTYLLYKTTKNVHHIRGLGNAINTDS
jgi:hypothetical protein